ncbi:TPA: host cell division inhibitor Icd-like protein [Klebsiella pneumoniae]|nr:host cell division inhibitor Icd-like protein [Klebsiella pneumoniae]
MRTIQRPDTGPGRSYAQIWPSGIAASTKARYSYPAGVNPPAGRCNPCKLSATPDAASVFFIVAISAHLHPAAFCRTVSMVALVGQLSGWPVSDNTGIATPISVTAPLERCNSGGDSLTLLSEAAAMVATPTQLHPEFTFHFLAVRRSDLNDKPHRESVTAPDELTARRLLAGNFVLCFAGRVPAEGVRHA